MTDSTGTDPRPTPPTGFWTTDAPLSPEQVDEDMALVRQIVIPDGIHINSAEFYVNGRVWYWQAVAVAFGSIRREPVEQPR